MRRDFYHALARLGSAEAVFTQPLEGSDRKNRRAQEAG
jgi:hypothetical protein